MITNKNAMPGRFKHILIIHFFFYYSFPKECTGRLFNQRTGIPGILRRNSHSPLRNQPSLHKTLELL